MAEEAKEAQQEQETEFLVALVEELEHTIVEAEFLEMEIHPQQRHHKVTTAVTILEVLHQHGIQGAAAEEPVLQAQMPLLGL
ncbi:MAG: hypothetical protein CMI60_00600 [Parvibaculum sp.]|nr:hypothetical protein [Parvibaculum sp.]